MRPRAGKICRMVVAALAVLSAPEMTVSAMEEAEVRELSEQIGALQPMPGASAGDSPARKRV